MTVYVCLTTMTVYSMYYSTCKVITVSDQTEYKQDRFPPVRHATRSVAVTIEGIDNMCVDKYVY